MRIVRALALVTVLLGGVTAGAQELLTNESVIAMIKAGLSESVVVAKVQSSASRKFDLTTTGLIALKQAGVSDRVIETMMAAPAAPGATAARPPDAPAAVGGVKLRDRDVIYYVQDGKPVELAALLGETKTEGMPFGGVSTELVLKGRRANVRIVETQPVFLSAYPATDAVLVRLEPGKKKDDRNLKVGGGGGYWTFSMRSGVRDKDRVETTAERTEQGLYRVTPREPLAAGEYGFIVFAGSGTAKVFDFGRD
ncbi:MAG: hypothetical protein HYR51_08435 [Candidatus Rokubacteria bacterium]|nr:hypothetical protein [Candidatus Rokubacteria bacterium]